MASPRQNSSDPNVMMDGARGLQALVRSFDDHDNLTSNIALFQGQFIAAPVLLSLAMELALKAWWARENRGSEIPRTHDLEKLFDGLKQDTRSQLEGAHSEIPSPVRGLPPFRAGLRSILASNKYAFVQWRYLHEQSRARFPTGEFNEALSSVIKEFGGAAR